jgi:hypothetical protein
MINFSREWAMPHRDTFSIKPIQKFVLRYLANSKVSVDPFARNSQLCTYRNDLNPETKAENHVDVCEFLSSLIERGVVADLVIFDPPYSLEQLKRSYESIGQKYTMQDGWLPNNWTKAKNLCNQLLGSRGAFLNFGWTTNGMGLKRGFEIVEIMLVNHGTGHNDTICMAEKRAMTTLDGE